MNNNPIQRLTFSVLAILLSTTFILVVAEIVRICRFLVSWIHLRSSKEDTLNPRLERLLWSRLPTWLASKIFLSRSLSRDSMLMWSGWPWDRQMFSNFFRFSHSSSGMLYDNPQLPKYADPVNYGSVARIGLPSWQIIVALPIVSKPIILKDG